MNHRQVRKLIDYVLTKIGLGSELASELVFLTGLAESRYEYIRQIGDGPAFSPWQIEIATAYDTCKNYLAYRAELAEKIADVLFISPELLIEPDKEKLQDLLWMNFAAGIVFCRLKYRRVPKPLPTTQEECAMYWKKWYNSDLGRGTVTHFLELADKRKDNK